MLRSEVTAGCACATSDHDDHCDHCGAEFVALSWTDDGFRVCKSGCAPKGAVEQYRREPEKGSFV